MTSVPIDQELDAGLAALRRDYSKLSARIKCLTHSVKCECDGVTLRVHYPAFRQGQATVNELIASIYDFLTPFCLPRAQIEEVNKQYGKIDADSFAILRNQLAEEARSLFKRANKATNRNGEAGELLLYVLTEWILGAPQLLAKMSLKTSSGMPVHGSDGVHVRYCNDTGRLLMYWGESKLYANLEDGIAAAVPSMIASLAYDKSDHEINLVQRNISFAGLDDASKAALLKFLDPSEDQYNERHDVLTCMIGFNLAEYAAIAAGPADQADAQLSAAVTQALQKASPGLAKLIKGSTLANIPIEMFILPVPSVQDFRNIFQEKIGWYS